MAIVIDENITPSASNASCSSNATESDIDCSGIVVKLFFFNVHKCFTTIIIILYRCFEWYQ